MPHPLLHLWTLTPEGWAFPCPTCGKLRVYDRKRATKVVAERQCGSCAQAGHPASERQKKVAAETGRKTGPLNKGRKRSEETKAKMRKARAGKKPALGMKHTDQWKAGQSARSMGHVVTAKTRKKISLAHHRRYGTVPNPNKPTQKELGRWAYEVLKGDHATCQICGFVKDKRKSVVAHHVFSKSKHPALALSVNNGITICVPCHKEEHRLNGQV